jgi:molybdopterin-guanine dinucleotide biosynthesis protein A
VCQWVRKNFKLKVRIKVVAMFNINVPGVILAGGQSRRMKHKDKSFIKVGEKTLLDMTIERLKSQSHKMAINTNSYSSKYKRYALPILHDRLEGFLGPLAGILTAMKWAEDIGYEKVITVAVDTPLFPENLLRELYKNMEFNNSDIVFAASSVNNKQVKLLHPVFGLWKTHLCDDLKKELERGVRKVTLWSERHKVSSVTFANELIDPFFNINTPDDIKLLKECLIKK